MLNNIEIEFENFMQAMYGTQTISQAQEKDMEKSFFAGMYVCLNILHSFDDNEDTATQQLETLHERITSKITQLMQTTQKGSE